jgi:hypothetical protein
MANYVINPWKNYLTKIQNLSQYYLNCRTENSKHVQ